METEKTETMEVDLTDWIGEELKKIESTVSADYEQLPSFKPAENKTEIIAVDISKPWDKWIDPNDSLVKKKIPVHHDGEKKLFWLNTRNPVYKHLLEHAYKAQSDKKNQFIVKILRTGQQQNTRYIIVE